MFLWLKVGQLGSWDRSLCMSRVKQNVRMPAKTSFKNLSCVCVPLQVLHQSSFTVLYGQRICFLQSSLGTRIRKMILMCFLVMLVALQKMFFNVNIDHYGRRVYDHVFGYNIEIALSNEETWRHRNRPGPIYIQDVFPTKLIHQNGIAGKRKLGT